MLCVQVPPHMKNSRACSLPGALELVVSAFSAFRCPPQHFLGGMKWSCSAPFLIWWLQISSQVVFVWMTTSPKSWELYSLWRYSFLEKWRYLYNVLQVLRMVQAISPSHVKPSHTISVFPWNGYILQPGENPWNQNQYPSQNTSPASIQTVPLIFFPLSSLPKFVNTRNAMLKKKVKCNSGYMPVFIRQKFTLLRKGQSSVPEEQKHVKASFTKAPQ